MDDAAAVLHLAHGFLGGHEHAGDVDRDHALVGFEFDVFDRAAEGQAGVVDQNVDAPKGVDGLRNRRTHRLRFTGIRRNRHGAAAFAGNDLHHFPGLVRRGAVGQCHLRTVGGQAPGNGRADRTRAAGNQGNFSGKREGLGRHDGFTLGLR
ncbi:hypothetical protein D3C78_1408230 [compost metagenome]